MFRNPNGLRRMVIVVLCALVWAGSGLQAQSKGSKAPQKPPKPSDCYSYDGNCPEGSVAIGPDTYRVVGATEDAARQGLQILAFLPTCEKERKAKGLPCEGTCHPGTCTSFTVFDRDQIKCYPGTQGGRGVVVCEYTGRLTCECDCL